MAFLIAHPQVQICHITSLIVHMCHAKYAGLAKHIRLHVLVFTCKDLADAASHVPQLGTCILDSAAML